MKKKITNFVRNLGGSTAYSGNTRTMYINDPKKLDIEQRVLDVFGLNLPFKLQTNQP